LTTCANFIWSGNEIPVFKGNAVEMKKLEQLLHSNVKDCSYEEGGFNLVAMRKYILSHFTERCRRIAKGHNYLEINCK
jgi:hypothetical protein